MRQCHRPNSLWQWERAVVARASLIRKSAINATSLWEIHPTLQPSRLQAAHSHRMRRLPVRSIRFFLWMPTSLVVHQLRQCWCPESSKSCAAVGAPNRLRGLLTVVTAPLRHNIVPLDYLAPHTALASSPPSAAPCNLFAALCKFLA
jgi:hypothetical protein